MENNEVVENVSQEENVNNSTENIIVDNTSNTVSLDDIHQDLGIILCFLVFFVLVILLKYAYKFFDMVFKF